MLRFTLVRRSVERIEHPSVNALMTWTCFSKGSTFIMGHLCSPRGECYAWTWTGLAWSNPRKVCGPAQRLASSGGALFCGSHCLPASNILLEVHTLSILSSKILDVIPHGCYTVKYGQGEVIGL